MQLLLKSMRWIQHPVVCTYARGLRHVQQCHRVYTTIGSASACLLPHQVMSRLARLESELAAERSRREAAEAEMRALMGTRGSNR
jgi:hypothetical protein